jgi:predicted porin
LWQLRNELLPIVLKNTSSLCQGVWALLKSNQLPIKVVGLGSFHPNIPLFNFWSLFMMKKTLVAAAALAATGAFAQVTLSGNLDVAFASQGAIQQQRSNTNSSSAMTFAGTEALNNDLSASFTLVTEIDLQKGQGGSTSTGAQTGATGQTFDMWNRGANLALASKSMGTLRLGRQNDAWWETQGQFNTSGSNSFSFTTLTGTQSNMATTGLLTSSYAATNAGNAGWTGTTFTYVSGVSYATPRMNGFQAKVQQNVADYSLSTQTVNPGAAFSLNFDGGAFKAALATSSKAGANGTVGHSLTVYGASYTFGNTTLTAATNKSTFEGSLVALHDSTAVGFGANYRFNPSFDASLSYATLTNDEVSANKATLIGVVGRYSLSKRTSLYAGVGTVNNEGTSTQTALWSFSGTTGATVNATTTSSMFGIRHQF